MAQSRDRVGPRKDRWLHGRRAELQAGAHHAAWPPSPVMMTSSPSSRNFLVCPLPSSMALVPLHDSSSMEPKLSGVCSRKQHPCDVLASPSAPGALCFARPGNPREGRGTQAPWRPTQWPNCCGSAPEALQLALPCAWDLGNPDPHARPLWPGPCPLGDHGPPDPAMPDALLGAEIAPPTGGCGQDLQGSDWPVCHPQVTVFKVLGL